ncbi:MAG: hypothetical protein ACJ71Z_09585 [Aeromicrobium sp.]
MTDSDETHTGQHVDQRHPGPAAEPVPFQVFRRAGLYLATAIAAAVAAAGVALTAYLRDVPWLWPLAIVLLVLGVAAVPGIADTQTPVFVADEHGVRMHVRDNWVGLLWREIGEVVVEPAAGRRDARIRITSKDARNTYVTPVGFTTSVSVAEAAGELARRRAAAAY